MLLQNREAVYFGKTRRYELMSNTPVELDVAQVFQKELKHQHHDRVL